MTKSLALAAFLLVSGTTALANPGYYVVTVYDNQGEKSLDFRYWSVKRPGRAETIWPELGFGYGVTSRWYTEFYASTIGTSSADLKLDTWNWQNDYLLTQGQYPFDLALHSNLARAHDSDEGYTLEFGPAVQTEVGRLQLNGNLFFERDFRSEYGGATQLKYQWQARYHWKPALEFGLQGFGELGDWNHWAPRNRQSHRAGPALFGSLPVGASQTIKYQVAYLSGSIYGSHGNMLTLRLQYAF
ncbi:MAG: hypothetical protein V4488_19445 [Pseudomonadota bacterium]